MNRIVWMTAFGWFVVTVSSPRSLAQTTEPGPGAGGAVLRDPLAAPVPSSPSAAAQPSYVESLLGKNPSTGNNAQNTLANKLASLAPSNAGALNDDIKIKEADGPFVIFIQSYTGEDCHKLARQMVAELRAAYKLNAYTFNKGAQEKQKEYERVMDVIAKRKELYQQKGLPADARMRIGFINIQEQCAVLLGGYKSEEAARRALDGVRKLKPLDPGKVMLDKIYTGELKKDSTGATTLLSKAEKLQEGYVNPFLGAFVGHNPTIEQKRPKEWDALDIELLRKLNAGETYSLLDCKKPWTLVVKDFRTPTLFQQKAEKGSFLESLGLGGKSNQRVDAAATSAHYLAEWLRKANLEAYVLHTKYTSIVCVGGYDSREDPSMRNMAGVIESKIYPQIAQLMPQLPNQPMAQVMPMQVPR